MKLTPIEPVSRAGAGVRLGYAIRFNKGGKSSGAGTLEISIHSDLVRALKAKSNDPLRLDGDLKAGKAQLTPMANLIGKATRRLHVTKSGRGQWQIPYSGMVPEFFPLVKEMTMLTEAEVTSDGLLFNLHRP